jgi:hypothetical protein
VAFLSRKKPTVFTLRPCLLLWHFFPNRALFTSIPGHFFGAGRVGPGQEKARLKFLQLRPGMLGQKFVRLSGRQAKPSVNHCFFQPRPGPLLLSGQKSQPRPGLTACFGLTGRAIFGPSRTGLPVLRLVYFSVFSHPRDVGISGDLVFTQYSPIPLNTLPRISPHLLGVKIPEK